MRERYRIPPALEQRAIGHIWDTYVPAQTSDAHHQLRRLGRPRSVALVRRVIDNGTEVGAGVRGLTTIPVERFLSQMLVHRVTARISQLISWPQFLRFAEREIASANVSLLHVHFGTTAARLGPLLDSLNMPVVVTFYGADGSAAVRSPRWRDLYSSMFRKVDLIIVLTDIVKERLIDLGCPPDLIRVYQLPAGIEEYPYRESTPENGVVRFICAARFVEKKGHFMLLEAYEQLIAEGRDVRLTLIGYGPLKDAIIERIRQSKLAHVVSVIDTGLGGDFARTYHEQLIDHDIFVLPSIAALDGDDEGGPALTLVCAQAAGLPVITSRFPGSELSVVDGETGVFADADPSSLAAAMRALADNPDRWRTLGAAASKLVNHRFSAHQQMETLLELYDEAIARRGRRATS